MTEVAVDTEAMPGSTDLPGREASTTEIARRTEQTVQVMPLMSDQEMTRYWRLAQGLAASRMFKDANQAEQAFAKILIGRDLGVSPTRALMTIDLVQGAIQLRGVLLASWVRQSADYDYKIVTSTHEQCVLRFLGFPTDEQLTEEMVRHRGQWWEVLEPDIEFTIADAKRAQLLKQDSNWEKHPKNMCFWRCMSNGVKFHAPELFAGMPVYVEGEIEPPLRVESQQDAAPGLPAQLVDLVAQAHAIDALAWSENEVLARLPHQKDPKFQPTVDGIAAELQRWLSEHPAPPEPEDADVVDEVVDGEPVLDDAGAQPDPDELGSDVQARYESDETFRGQVDVLLHRQADLEAALEEAIADNDDRRQEDTSAELDRVAGDLDALGVARGWFPVAADQQSLEV